MSADLQVVTGELRIVDGAAVQLVDALALLPTPTDAQEVRRTFPRGAEQGWVHMEPIAAGRFAFHAVLPRRSDAAGVVPGEGLYANGLWHPQPMTGDSVPVCQWQVELELPAGVLGTLNGVVGATTLQWSGQAERLSLAVVPGGVSQVLALPAGEVQFISRRPRPRQQERITNIVAEAWPGPGAPRLVIVDAPLRRHLARPGVGVLYVSDRATRLTGRLWRYHSAAVGRAALAAALPIADPWTRDLAAGLVVDGMQRPDPRDALRRLAWVPEIDTLLYDGRLPYYSDIFDEVWGGDRLEDDLLEVLAPHSPGRVVARRVRAAYGDAAANALRDQLLHGAPLAEAAAIAAVPYADLLAWGVPTPRHTLDLQVERVGDGAALTVTRNVAEGAPAEPVNVVIDGVVRQWMAGPGPDAATWQLNERPQRVQLDPQSDLRLASRSGDTWPARWTAVASFFPYELDLNAGRLSGSAQLALRRQYDTRWLWLTGLSTDPEDVVGANLSLIHYRGPLQDRRHRPWRLWLGVNGALLDPDFRPTDAGKTAVGGTVGVAQDTRIDDTFQTTGHRVSFSLDGGALPGADLNDPDMRWGAARLAGKALLPLGGRAGVGARLRIGAATGGVEHRLLTLGGGSEVQGLAPDAVIADRLLTGGVELRVEPVRFASVPLPLMWLSDLQLSVGGEAGVARAVAELHPQAAAAGWTVGLAAVADVFGARPSTLGVWVAAPVWTNPDGLDATAGPELYLRLENNF